MDRGKAALAGLAALIAAGAARAQEAPAPGDAAQGEKVFAKCRSCHQIGEGAHNAVGPELNGLIGRHAASVPGYNYSEAMKGSGIVWDEPTFKDYIRDPRAKVPGTKMTFAGLSRQKDIDDVAAYLESFDADGKRAP